MNTCPSRLRRAAQGAMSQLLRWHSMDWDIQSSSWSSTWTCGKIWRPAWRWRHAMSCRCDSSTESFALCIRAGLDPDREGMPDPEVWDQLNIKFKLDAEVPTYCHLWEQGEDFLFGDTLDCTPCSLSRWPPPAGLWITKCHLSSMTRSSEALRQQNWYPL